MKSSTWQSICRKLEAQEWEVIAERKNSMGKFVIKGVGDEMDIITDRGGWGIAIENDPLALRYQRLARVRSHVGSHFCQAWDREQNMKVSYPCTHIVAKNIREATP